MPDIALPKGTGDLHFTAGSIKVNNFAGDFHHRRTLARTYIDSVAAFQIGQQRRACGLHHIVNVNEIAALLAILKYGYWTSFPRQVGEDRQNPRIWILQRLSRPIYILIAQ